MLTDKQIAEIDELASRGKHWSRERYDDLPLTPDVVLSLTTELKRQRQRLNLA